MSNATEQDLAAQLERFVHEQAARYGEVISYVPVRTTARAVESTPIASAVSNPEADSDSAARLIPISGGTPPSGETFVSNGITSSGGGASMEVSSPGGPSLLEGLALKLAPYHNEPWARADSLEALRQDIEGCQRCQLGQTRNKLVFGVGDPRAKVLLIGEAPGADEDASGEPFVGRAGQLLNKMIEAVQFSREEVYIANILKSRPPNNREPQPVEIAACEVYLWKQILLLQPKLILCLGRVAGTNLLKRNEALGKMRGQVFDFFGIRTMVTYHPAALLRNPDWKHGAWEDLKQFRRMYDELR